MSVTHPKIRRLTKSWRVAQFADKEGAIGFAVKQWLDLANQAIHSHGQFAVALSGGSSPAAIYHELTLPTYREQVDWSKVLLFWGDERSVPADHHDSNYYMGMEAGLNQLPVPEENIFRMHAESDLEVHAAAYDRLIKEHANGVFDLVMLGMGEDGHTASLFPNTDGLAITDRLVIANYVPQLETWRMSLTFPCINAAHNIHLYVLGEKKQQRLEEVLTGAPDRFPVQQIGTDEHPALWITDCTVLID
jgi:6-phosphogluconolactonase